MEKLSKVKKLVEDIVQMPVRISRKRRDELKIHAINQGLTLNELLVRYIDEGFRHDKKQVI